LSWKNIQTIQVVLDSNAATNPASATLKITDKHGTLHEIRIHQDPALNTEPYYPPGATDPSGPRFTIADADGGFLFTLIGTSRKFGLNLRPLDD
jgi:hypothetical protein